MIKTVIIGLDGATFKFIDPLIKKGELPNLEFLIRNGARGNLNSTIPSMSAPAWVSFMTGKNPGKHGVYDFEIIDSRTYQARTMHLINSSFYQGKTLFDALANYEIDEAVITVPMTYPPWEIKGVMVSGPPTPESSKPFTYPKDISTDLPKLHWKGKVEWQKMGPEDKLYQIMYALDRRKEVVSKFIHEYPFIMAVINSTDAAHHKFWMYYDSESPYFDEELHMKYGDYIYKVYKGCDEFVGSILNSLEPPFRIFVISDHGAQRRPYKRFNLNAWLYRNGYAYLEENKPVSSFRMSTKIKKILPPVMRWRIKNLLRKRAPKRMKQKFFEWSNVQPFDWSKTKAYAFNLYVPYCGVIVNVKGRQTHGTIPMEDYDTIREAIKSDLLALRDPDTSEQVVIKVFNREEIYNGPYTEQAPDLILELNPNYEFYKGSPDEPVFSEVPEAVYKHTSGVHDQMGIFIAYGEGIKKGVEIDNINLIDVSPTVMASMEIPVSEDMDGRVIEEVFDKPVSIKRVKDEELFRETIEKEHYKLSEEEEEDMKRHLKDLGYLG